MPRMTRAAWEERAGALQLQVVDLEAQLADLRQVNAHQLQRVLAAERRCIFLAEENNRLRGRLGEPPVPEVGGGGAW